jgi:glycosyltransferase involved in cell wall biosynthesis
MILSNSIHSPLRVLHIVGCMDRGGVETWLMNLLRLQNPEWKFDILVFKKGNYDEEAESLGATLVRLPHRPPSIYRNQKEIHTIIKNGHYDVVHHHPPIFPGLTMKIAAEYNVPVRIVHIHNTSRGQSLPINLIKNLYYHFFDKSGIIKYATSVLACSQESGQSFLQDIWHKKRTKTMVYCGIPFEQFDKPTTEETRKSLCKQYGIPHDAIVIGSIGRLTCQKNYSFLLDVFAELVKRNSRYVLFIAGEGELRSSLEKKVRFLSLQEKIFLPGVCNNIPDLTCSLFDVFCLPSIFEGFGIVFLEATAGGLHTVCSNVITKDILEYIPDRFTSLSFSSPISVWCDAIEEGIKKRISPQEGVIYVRKTLFSIEQSMDSLMTIYRGNV